MKTISPVPENHALNYERLLFTEKNQLNTIVEKTGTPVFLFDKEGLVHSAKSLLQYSEALAGTHYAEVRRCAGKEILSALGQLGFGAWCENISEVRQALHAGIPGHKILYSALYVDSSTCELLRDLDAVLLLGDATTVPDLVPRRVELNVCIPALRTNALAPLSMQKNRLGFSLENLKKYCAGLTEKGCSELGLAMLSEGNITSEDFYPAKLETLIYLADNLQSGGIEIKRLNLGSGMGIDYGHGLKHLDWLPVWQRLEKIGQAHQAYALEFCLWRQILEPNAVFIMQILDVLGTLHQKIIVNAVPDMLNNMGIGHTRHIVSPGRKYITGCNFSDVMANQTRNHGWFAKGTGPADARPGEYLVMHDVGGSIPQFGSAPCFVLESDGGMHRLDHGDK